MNFRREKRDYLDLGEEGSMFSLSCQAELLGKSPPHGEEGCGEAELGRHHDHPSIHGAAESPPRPTERASVAEPAPRPREGGSATELPPRPREEGGVAAELPPRPREEVSAAEPPPWPREGGVTFFGF